MNITLKIYTMKNLVIALVLALGLSMSAQEKRATNEKMTVAQRNELQLKKMTLELNLTTSQQKELAPIIAEQNEKRESRKVEMKKENGTKKSKSADEKFENSNKRLDSQIAFKNKMRKILDDEQMKKWEANSKSRKNKAIAHHRKNKKAEVKS
jgi:hypothetical protein